jgi:hypothetical protein
MYASCAGTWQLSAYPVHVSLGVPTLLGTLLWRRGAASAHNRGVPSLFFASMRVFQPHVNYRRNILSL